MGSKRLQSATKERGFEERIWQIQKYSRYWELDSSNNLQDYRIAISDLKKLYDEVIKDKTLGDQFRERVYVERCIHQFRFENGKIMREGKVGFYSDVHLYESPHFPETLSFLKENDFIPYEAETHPYLAYILKGILYEILNYPGDAGEYFEKADMIRERPDVFYEFKIDFLIKLGLYNRALALAIQLYKDKHFNGNTKLTNILDGILKWDSERPEILLLKAFYTHYNEIGWYSDLDKSNGYADNFEERMRCFDKILQLVHAKRAEIREEHNRVPEEDEED